MFELWLCFMVVCDVVCFVCLFASALFLVLIIYFFICFHSCFYIIFRLSFSFCMSIIRVAVCYFRVLFVYIPVCVLALFQRRTSENKRNKR